MMQNASWLGSTKTYRTRTKTNPNLTAPTCSPPENAHVSAPPIHVAIFNQDPVQTNQTTQPANPLPPPPPPCTPDQGINASNHGLMRCAPIVLYRAKTMATSTSKVQLALSATERTTSRAKIATAITATIRFTWRLLTP